MTSVLAFTLGLCVAASPASAQTLFTFAGTNTGSIPDGDTSGRTINFAVSGINGSVYDVGVFIDIDHPWIGDLNATLISPGGTARLALFGRPGSRRGLGLGSSANLAGFYAFDDRGTPNFISGLSGLGNNDTVPVGTYRAVSRNSARSDAGGCPTSLRGVFGGLSGTQLNGTWTLVVSDVVTSEVGTVNAAILVVRTRELFSNGFEPSTLLRGPQDAVSLAGDLPVPAGGSPAAPGHCINKVVGDVTGDGLTDYVLVRAPMPPEVDWFVRENLGNGTTAGETSFRFGLDTDLFDLTDFDGDRIADPTVWRPGPAGTARFIVRQSSRNGAVREFVLGDTGSNPLASGDYDGDGIDDPAVTREGFGEAKRLIYRSSITDALVTISTGPAGIEQFISGGFDLTGDGRADILSQEADTAMPSLARYRVFESINGIELQTFTHDQPTALIVPGDYSGSFSSDVTAVRTVSGVRNWFTRVSGSGAVLPTVVFGATGDSLLLGDYDGDLLADHAFFRRTASPGPIGFQVRPSTAPASPWSIVFGSANDFAVTGSRVK